MELLCRQFVSNTHVIIDLHSLWEHVVNKVKTAVHFEQKKISPKYYLWEIFSPNILS